MQQEQSRQGEQRQQDQAQQQQQQQQQRQAGSGSSPPPGGRSRGGPSLPEPPANQDLMAFLDYTKSVAQVWSERTQARGCLEYQIADPALRFAIGEAWNDLDRKWNDTRPEILSVVKDFDAKFIELHGLSGPMMHFKLEIVRRSARALRRSIQQRIKPSQLAIRLRWRRMFEAIDVVLDSVCEAMPAATLASAVVGGLREFKDAAMAVSSSDR